MIGDSCSRRVKNPEYRREWIASLRFHVRLDQERRKMAETDPELERAKRLLVRKLEQLGFQARIT